MNHGTQARKDIEVIRQKTDNLTTVIAQQQKQIQELTQKLNTFTALLIKAGLEAEDKGEPVS